MKLGGGGSGAPGGAVDRPLERPVDEDVLDHTRTQPGLEQGPHPVRIEGVCGRGAMVAAGSRAVVSIIDEVHIAAALVAVMVTKESAFFVARIADL